jgi:hypothetical protein
MAILTNCVRFSGSAADASGEYAADWPTKSAERNRPAIGSKEIALQNFLLVIIELLLPNADDALRNRTR